MRLQPLGRLEGQDTARGDLDLVAGLRVAPLARGLFADAEVPEADDLHVVPLLEGVEHLVEHRLDHRRRLSLREAMRRYCVDEVILGQRCHPPSSSRSRKPRPRTARLDPPGEIEW